MSLTCADVESASARIAGQVREVAVARADAGPGWWALGHCSTPARSRPRDHELHPGPRHLPDAGGDDRLRRRRRAGVRVGTRFDVPATVFVPATAPAVKVARLRSYGADVRLVGTEYAEVLEACDAYAAETEALRSHAYDHPLVAAGAGTLLTEVHARTGASARTVVVAVGGRLLAGVATVAGHLGVRTVAVEPRALPGPCTPPSRRADPSTSTRWRPTPSAPAASPGSPSTRSAATTSAPCW